MGRKKGFVRSVTYATIMRASERYMSILTEIIFKVLIAALLVLLIAALVIATESRRPPHIELPVLLTEINQALSQVPGGQTNRHVSKARLLSDEIRQLYHNYREQNFALSNRLLALDEALADLNRDLSKDSVVALRLDSARDHLVAIARSAAGIQSPLEVITSAFRIAYDGTVYFFRGLREFLSFSVVLSISILMFLFSERIRYRVRDFVRSVGISRISFFGTDVSLTTENAAETERTVECAINGYREKAQREYDKLAQQNFVREKLENFVNSDVMSLVRERLKDRKASFSDIGDLRCTIYVPDALFDDALYQLVDYYPFGGGRGRSKSYRFGLIGLSWRLGRSYIAPLDTLKSVESKIERWGMTREEAEGAGPGRKSLMCLIARDRHKNRVGLVYLDSKRDSLFSNEMLARLESSAKLQGLGEALARVGQELRARSPQIKVHS